MKKNRFISAILAAALTINLLPGFAPKAEAAGGGIEPKLTAVSPLDLGLHGFTDDNHYFRVEGSSTYIMPEDFPEEIVDYKTDSLNHYAKGVSGQYWVWGKNTNGTLFVPGNAAEATSPMLSPVLEGAKDVASGSATSAVFIDANNKLQGIGDNRLGQLGLPSAIVYANVTSIPFPETEVPVKVYARDRVTFVITESGLVYSTGSGADGSNASGTTSNQFSFRKVTQMSNVKGIGLSHLGYRNYAYTADGKYLSWGAGVSSPVTKSTPANVVDIAGNGQGGILLTSEGKVWTYGNNTYGQLMSNSKATGSSSFSFIEATKLYDLIGSDKVVRVFGIKDANFAILTESGQYYIWGKNGSSSTEAMPFTKADGLAVTLPKPPAPTGLEFTSAVNSVRLSWDLTPGAQGYKILRDGSQVGDVTTNTFTDSGLLSGTKYVYTIVAYASGKNSDPATVSVHTLSEFLLGSQVVTAPNTYVEIGGTTFRVIGDNKLISLNGYAFTTWTDKYSAAESDRQFIGSLLDSSIATNWWDKLSPLEKSSIIIGTFPVQNTSGESIGVPDINYEYAPPTFEDTLSYKEIYGEFLGTRYWIRDRFVGNVQYVLVFGGEATRNSTPGGSQYSGTDFAGSYFVTNISEDTVLSGNGTVSRPYRVESVAPAKPPKPLGFVATEVTDNSISFSWTAEPDKSYILERNGYSIYSGTGSAFKDTSISSGQNYSYSLYVVKGSAKSDGVFLTIQTKTKLGKVSNFIASEITSNSANLSWGPVDGASLYEVSAGDQVVYSGSTTEAMVTGLTPKTRHQYTVRALSVNPSYISGEGTNLEFTTLPNKPTSPVDFKVDFPTIRAIYLSWGASSDADSYALYRDGNLVYEGLGNSFVDMGVPSDTEFVYRLVARNKSGESESVTVTTRSLPEPPEQPTSFEVVSKTFDSITLSWNKGNADKFELRQFGRVIYSGTDLSFKDTGLLPGNRYDYELRAIKGDNTANPVILSATTPTEVVKPPLNFTVVEATYDSITLSWSPVDGALSYTVFNGSSMVHDGSSLTTKISNLQEGTKYVFNLRANGMYTSSDQVSLEVSTRGRIPASPVGFKVSRVSFDSASFQWNHVPGASSYKVYRDGEVLVYDGSLTTFKDTTLAPTSTYDYTLVAANQWGDSEPVGLSVTTVAEPATILFTPSPPMEGTITFKFNVVEGAYRYEVESSPSGSSNGGGQVSALLFSRPLLKFLNVSTLSSTILVSNVLSPDSTGLHRVYTANGDGTYTVSDQGSVIGQVSEENGQLPFMESGVSPGTNRHYDITAFRVNSQGADEVIGGGSVDVTTPSDGSGGTLPTPTPTATPTPSSTPSTEPSPAPTAGASSEPSPTPSPEPSPVVTPSPSVEPTPTVVPSESPSPTPSATPSPTVVPTIEPSSAPTSTPVVVPSIPPVVVPSPVPTVSPSPVATASPSAAPTSSPTASPSTAPTSVPTATTDVEPTTIPSEEPVVLPSSTPSAEPSPSATTTPSEPVETVEPTVAPTPDVVVPSPGVVLPATTFVAPGTSFTTQAKGVIGHVAGPTSVFSSVYTDKAVEYLKSVGIIGQYNGQGFDPSKIITRAEFAVMLQRSMKYSPSIYDGRFYDLDKTQWYYPELIQAISSGVTLGYNDNTYRPDQSIPREQVAVMLSNILRKEGELPPYALPTLTDFDQTVAWAKDSVARSLGAGLYDGLDLQLFQPKKSITNGEASVLLYNLIQILK